MTNFLGVLCKVIGRWRRDERGNVAMIFGLSLLPIAGLAAAAVDYSRANALKADIQAAVDATALMVSKNAPTMSATAINDQAQKYFDSIFRQPTPKVTVAITTNYTTQGGSQLTVGGTTTLTTGALKVLGVQSLDVGSSSTIAWGNSRLRVALVLDNTGSMSQSNKMTALKSATKSLLTQLHNAAANNGDVYVSIIPFTKDVNVDPTNYNQNWVRWDLWDEVNGSCSNSNSTTKSTCTGSCSNSNYTTQSTCTAVANGVCNHHHSTLTTQSACVNAGYTWKLSTWSSATWTTDNHNTWNGCVTDRDQTSATTGYDLTNTAPSTGTPATLFPAEQYGVCPVALMGLTYDWTGLNAKVDAMVPNGNTNQAIGLAWGWQSLTNPPLTVPAMDPNYKYQQVIILLTDGLNTEDRWYTDQTSIDNRQQILCNNIKAAGATLYAVQVNTSGDPTSALLQNCASDSSKFFLLTSSTEIVTIFTQIGNQISQLRIAK